MPPPLAHAWLTAGRRTPAGGPQLTGARARLGRQVLRELSGGAAPAKVIATGHSLGGGLASLCGVWAALQWPGADVRVVTLGSPKVGNQAWVDVRARPGRPARPAPARARKGGLQSLLRCPAGGRARCGMACMCSPWRRWHAYGFAGRLLQGTRVRMGCHGIVLLGSCATLADKAVDATDMRVRQAFRTVVGRSYRMVDRWDVVPSLPPFEDYIPLPFPLWIQARAQLRTIGGTERPTFGRCPGCRPSTATQGPAGVRIGCGGGGTR